MTLSSPFDILGLPIQHNIDLKLLDQNYRNRMILHHPDKATSSIEKETASKQSQIINEAYQQLKDPLKRARAIMVVLNIEHPDPDPIFLAWILNQENKEIYRKAWDECEQQLNEAILKNDQNTIRQIYGHMLYIYKHI